MPPGQALTKYILDDPEYERWRRAADSSLEMARLAADHGHHHHACLHAEQAAQQAVKGLLHGVGAGADSRGHDLTALGALAAEALRATLSDQLRSALGRLSRHYLPSRYPDALPGGAPGDHYGQDDSLQAVTDAVAVIGFVDRWWQALATASSDARGGSEKEGRGW